VGSPGGATGPTGASGPIGATGATGPQGVPGLDGSAGINGATGATGPAGSPGGATGATGPAGSAGGVGATGATGPTGVSGGAGATGSTGPSDTTSWTSVVKASDESVSGSTVLQNDDELFFTATSGGIYEFELVLIYASPAGGGTPDIRFGLGEDATTGRGLFSTIANLTTADAPTSTQRHTDQGSGTTTSAGTGTADRVMVCKGGHRGNGGTFRLVWAQNTSDANATIVRAGSVLRYRRIV
jgi:hypothetical protein